MSNNKKNTERKKGKDSHDKTKPDVPIAYLYVYYKLKEILKTRYTICYLKTSEVIQVLKMTLRIPKKMKYMVLAEMQSYGLVARINHQKYYISDKQQHINMLKRVKDCIDEFTFW